MKAYDTVDIVLGGHPYTLVGRVKECEATWETHKRTGNIRRWSERLTITIALRPDSSLDRKQQLNRLLGRGRETRREAKA